MSETQTPASNPKLLAAPAGIDVSLCSFKGLEAFQTLSKRYNWNVAGQTAFSIVDPQLCQKYEWLVRELYELTFPERKSMPYAISCAYKLLGAIETSLLLYYQVEDIAAGAIPPATREGVYKYMRFHNISLADFALEAPKMALAFKGYHYGVEDLDKLSTKLSLIRTLYKELNGDLSKLEDAWKLCMEDLGIMALGPTKP